MRAKKTGQLRLRQKHDDSKRRIENESEEDRQLRLRHKHDDDERRRETVSEEDRQLGLRQRIASTASTSPCVARVKY